MIASYKIHREGIDMMRGKKILTAAVITMALAAPLTAYANGPGMAGVQSTEAANQEAAGQVELTREQKLSNKIMELMNQRRTSEGRAVLASRQELVESAVLRAGELPQKASHDRPDGSAYYTAVNVSYNQIGENYAYACLPGMSDDEIAAFLVEGWMNSQVHHDNILNSEWNETGIGVFIQGDTVYALQLFMEATAN